MSGPGIAVIARGRIENCRPWARTLLEPEQWAEVARSLADEPRLALIALWADTVSVHALFLDEADGGVHPVSTEVRGGAYPALSPSRPSAARFERMVLDLWGHRAEGGLDQHPWLDHGRWPGTYPMSPRPGSAGASPDPPEFHAAEDEDLHQVPLGPAEAGLGEPGHLRLTALGETIVRAEARLGYAHRGVLLFMRGKSPRAAARYAARLAGDSTVAHSIAFARAAEAALGVEAPARAASLRAVMAEQERTANHLGDLALMCREAGFAVPDMRLGLHREQLARAAAVAFGHRLMMDCSVPGGVAADIVPGGPEALLRALGPLEQELPDLSRTLEDPAGFAANHEKVGLIAPALAARFAAGGIVGRASGRSVDTRQSPGYPPYDRLKLGMRVLSKGDVRARTALRFAEIEESIRLIRALLTQLPDGGYSVPLPNESGEGIGVAEGVRGDIWHWLRLDNGVIAAAFARDPGWAHWPLMEAALANSEIGDLALIRASINPGISGADL